MKRTLPQIIRYKFKYFSLSQSRLVSFFYKTLSVFVLLMINLYFFAIIGMLLFPRYYEVFKEQPDRANFTAPRNRSSNDSIPLIDDRVFAKNAVFSTIKDSLLNLVILLTTSNNPDIMIQSYAQNRLAGIYFILYVIVGKFISYISHKLCRLRD
jgi:hypothetical protein